MRRNCIGCSARDSHIASLKEQLNSKDLELQSLQNQYDELVDKLNNKIEHMLGMRKNISTGEEIRKGPVSIRPTNSISARIAHAERVESTGPEIEARNRAFRERTAELLNEVKPETEIIGDVKDAI